ncbi:MAG: hypothetical protein HeimC2_19610 [Candidatus Heimdallarchaeota archaeon LC_2]|nr:MAG: hypothetical protein HeimC2_19610 [Candidatus Heimdallarchaeota archaeon LC_2]
MKKKFLYDYFETVWNKNNPDKFGDYFHQNLTVDETQYNVENQSTIIKRELEKVDRHFKIIKIVPDENSLIVFVEVDDQFLDNIKSSLIPNLVWPAGLKINYTRVISYRFEGEKIIEARNLVSNIGSSLL